MVVPAIAYGVWALASLYTVGREIEQSRENKRYWADYKKNTGFTPRYKYRSGYYYNYATMLNSAGKFYNNSYNYGW